MKIFKEEEILDEAFRAQVIKEIESEENIDRKRDSYKKYEIYKDRVRKYTLEMLRKEMDEETINEMETRVSNVNIYKRVIDKKARVYKTPPRRETTKKREQKFLDGLRDYLNLDTKMKKANRILEGAKNCLVEIMPYQDALTGKWDYRITPLYPHLYDVIEDSQDRERPRVIIKSHFTDVHHQDASTPYDRDAGAQLNDFRDGDGRNQTIADSPSDDQEMDKKEYIWWSTKYHFTTNNKGQIIRKSEKDDGLNAIGKLPFVNLAKDQDGSFWALGGDDLVDGTVLINVLLSDINLTIKIQGMGIFYYFGKGVPKTVKFGVNNGITHDVQDGDPTPQVGFASSNPPIDQHIENIVVHLGLLLSTNAMSVSTVRTNLDVSTVSSGVHELISQSEPNSSIEDDQQLFADKEPEVVEIATLWHNLYHERGLLNDKAKKIGKLPLIDYSIKFGAIQQFFSEKEKLETIEKRLQLKISDMVDALMIDNPDLTEEQAMEKLKKMNERKLKDSIGKLKEIMEGANADRKEQDQLPVGSEQAVGEGEEQESED